MERHNNGRSQKNPATSGLIYVVGIGPGSTLLLSPQAQSCIESASVIIGYSTYLEQVEDLLEGKEVISSSMMQEVARCEKTIELAMQGEVVAIISGGDPGIYGMAGLIYEVAAARDYLGKIEVVPGIAALNSCAAVLGAPLMHDFTAISLSDLLTPMDIIEKRLHAAAGGDFVLVLYNPKSKKRTTQIEIAQQIILQYRNGSTPVGIVTGAYRDTQQTTITTLEGMLEHSISMQSTVIVGNSKSYCWNNQLITPRGYADKYSL